MKSWTKWAIKMAMELAVCVFYIAAIIISCLALRGCVTALQVWPQGISAIVFMICLWAMAIAYGLIVVGNCFQKAGMAKERRKAVNIDSEGERERNDEYA